MIKYETTENKYLYNSKTLEQIIDLLKSGHYYSKSYLTQENVSIMVYAIDTFLNNLQVVPQKVIKERHETEEEARAYFGNAFIQQFDSLMTSLGKEQTIVAIHGTDLETCSKICDTGLQYKIASLSSTAIQQSMGFSQHDMHYNNYEGLLNWPHRQYKGLVIIAIPLECYYKEGLWNHFRNTDTSFYGGQDYRIDSDFIVGYLDVEKKKIVLNPKYNRNHNYEGYVKDNELFHEIKGMTNDLMIKEIIKSEMALKSSKESNDKSVKEPKEKLDVSMIPDYIEGLLGVFNSIKIGYPNGFYEERYRYLLEQLSNDFSQIKKAIPLLKSNAQIEQENTSKSDDFDNENVQFDDDWDWKEDEDWTEDVETAKLK